MLQWASEGSPNGTQDNPYIKSEAKGFLIPGIMEWECAARYQNGTTWTAGSWLSGATADYTDSASLDVAVFRELYNGYGLGFTVTGVTSTAAVKSKNGNALGIYDMSGNVIEWCFNWYTGYIGQFRARRGGGFTGNSGIMRIGEEGCDNPRAAYSSLGFRFARTQ